MENSSKTGYKIKLSADEVKVNGYLMQLKQKEYDIGRAPNGIFPPKLHFFHAKNYIDKSPVFDVIKKMPKGEIYLCYYCLFYISTTTYCTLLCI